MLEDFWNVVSEIFAMPIQLVLDLLSETLALESFADDCGWLFGLFSSFF